MLTYTQEQERKKDLTTFILEKDQNQFQVGKPIHKMGMRASPTGELIFDNAKVPKSNRVGEEGDSVYHMMKNLEIERITIAGISLGIASACTEQCVKYAQEENNLAKKLETFNLFKK